MMARAPVSRCDVRGLAWIAAAALISAASVTAQEPLPRVILHRQAPEQAPENTWPAIAAGARYCVDSGTSIEIDVSGSLDGELFLFHDPYFDTRSDELLGPVTDWLWEEIEDVDFGGWFDQRFRGAVLPKFENVVAYCVQHRVPLTLDLKDGVSPRAVATVLKRLGAEDLVRCYLHGGVGWSGEKRVDLTVMFRADGDPDVLRAAAAGRGQRALFLDDARTFLDLSGTAPREPLPLPVTRRLPYRVEDLDPDRLAITLRAGGWDGRRAAARLRKHFPARAAAIFTATVAAADVPIDARVAAARALGFLAPSSDTKVEVQDVAAVTAALDSKDDALRAAAAWAVGRLHVHAALPALARLLTSDAQPAMVRAAAARALGRLGDPDALGPLQETAARERAAFLQRDPAEWPKVWDTLTSGNDPANSYWLAPRVLYACFWGLSQVRDPRALDVLLEHVRRHDVPQGARRVEDWFVCGPALGAAARTGDRRALLALRSHLLDATLPGKDQFYWVTRWFPADEAVPVLLDLLGSDRLYARQEGMYGLLRSGAAATAPLHEALSSPGTAAADGTRRAWAAWTLGWLGDRTAIEPLRAALSDSLALVRARAAWALGRLGGPAERARLEDLRSDSDPLVRAAAATAMARLEDR